MSAGGKSERISPTAYATGYFWYRHGLSHPALATPEGERYDRIAGKLMLAVRRLGGFSLTALMLARHRGIDAVLEQAIEEGRVGQVIEIAAGLSPRGWSFKRRYGARITYVETDLPQMLALKRRLLEQGGLLTPGHRLEVLDALADSGPQSLAALVETLDSKLGTAVISEGLMNYFDPATARGVWQRIAGALRRFPYGAYLADIYLRDRPTNPAAALFGGLPQLFVRGRMHLHFRTVGEVEDTMENCGFTQTLVHPAASLKGASEYAPIRGGDAVSVLEARV